MSQVANEILKALLDDVVQTVRVTMIRADVERDSDLIKSVNAEISNNSVVTIIANDYYEYVSRGRRVRARKVPIEDLIDWIKEESIRPRAGQTINQLAFAIQTSIYKNGIRGKRFANQVELNSLNILEEEFTQMLSEIITNDLQQAFSNS